MKNSQLLKRFLLFGGLAFFGMLVAVTLGLLYVNVRLQQDLLSRSPEYTSKELYSKAVDQVDHGQYQQAETYLEQALLKEDDATYRNQLAVVKYRLKKYDESVAQYQKLIDQGKDVAFAWNGIGNAYRDWADNETARGVEYRQKAIDAYEASAKADATYVAAYSNWALLLQAAGKPEQALAVLDQGIKATQSSELQAVRAGLVKK